MPSIRRIINIAMQSNYIEGNLSSINDLITEILPKYTINE